MGISNQYLLFQNVYLHIWLEMYVRVHPVEWEKLTSGSFCKSACSQFTVGGICCHWQLSHLPISNIIYIFNLTQACISLKMCSIFMPPRSKIGSIIVFVLSVILSFHNSVTSVWNFNLVDNFWTVSARAFTFDRSNSCDKTFLWVQHFLFLDLDLWVWPVFWKLEPY